MAESMNEERERLAAWCEKHHYLSPESLRNLSRIAALLRAGPPREPSEAALLAAFLAADGLTGTIRTHRDIGVQYMHGRKRTERVLEILRAAYAVDAVGPRLPSEEAMARALAASSWVGDGWEHLDDEAQRRYAECMMPNARALLARLREGA